MSPAEKTADQIIGHLTRYLASFRPCEVQTESCVGTSHRAPRQYVFASADLRSAQKHFEAFWRGYKRAGLDDGEPFSLHNPLLPDIIRRRVAIAAKKRGAANANARRALTPWERRLVMRLYDEAVADGNGRGCYLGIARDSRVNRSESCVYKLIRRELTQRAAKKTRTR